jgi:hypothetical protein
LCGYSRIWVSGQHWAVTLLILDCGKCSGSSYQFASMIEDASRTSQAIGRFNTYSIHIASSFKTNCRLCIVGTQNVGPENSVLLVVSGKNLVIFGVFLTAVP